MPGNDRSRNFASHRSLTFTNRTAIVEPVFGPPEAYSTPNFKEFKRVSHRRSLPQHGNVDQHSNPLVTLQVSQSHETRTASNGHVSHTIRNDRQIAFHHKGVEVAGQGRTAGFDVVAKRTEEVLCKFNALKINDGSNRNRKPPKSNKNTFTRQTNFRSLELYPTVEDMRRSESPSLEPNKVNGAYDNVEHYLNVQFHLLREDFVGSVRKGVHDFQSGSSNPSQYKYDGIRVYRETQFEHVRSTKSNKLGIVVNFDPHGKMRNFKWKESKRFMYGSLLLFTCNDFHAFFWCTVVERDVDALREGKVLVSLTENVRTDPRFFKRPYLMAECDAFFDPYFLVMQLLRNFDESSFPMSRYIVKGAVEPRYPAYVTDFGVLKVHNRVIAPITINPSEWPTADDMQLDRYQFGAFKAALTRDFCVIQGPPGTGKTFIGLKIVKNIWHNAKSFNHKLQLPILVVCSANHAVDQFLEGVLEFTKNVVRVGGQSRSEVMKRYNLRERARADNRFVSDRVLRERIKSCQRDIDRVGQLMKCATKPTGILSAKVLGDVVGPMHKGVVKDDYSLAQWLLPAEGLGGSYDERDFWKFKSQNEKKAAPEADQCEDDEDDVDDDEEQAEDAAQKTSYEVDDRGCYSISLQELSGKIIANTDRYCQLKKQKPQLCYSTLMSYKTDIIRLMKHFYFLKEKLDNPVHNEQYVRQNRLFEISSHLLDPNQRWLVYWQWTLRLVEILSQKLKPLEVLHSASVQQLEECRQQQDLEVMRRADVVGMTTSGAARLNRLLKSLHPAVVVVEEAGEVLETHVIASLTSKCQHVILIGDHEQLRPITAVYEMSKKYNMDVSLFERLVKNGMDCPVLNVQHRMRPEISCLISPLIYKDLTNHRSVLNFESIRGVEKDVFFVDHNEFENTLHESSSKQNEYEAEFVIHLAMYLIQQQYDPTKITILTTYAAQRVLLRNLQKRYSLSSQVKCIVVDKYQGEENDIVLLSLVRSNGNGNIGFLDTKNRVCVALSRAKKGFYMVGNMSCLARNSSLWRTIRQTLTNNDAIGNKLPLFCRIHEKRTLVASIDDFAAVKDGACGAICNQLLHCGHVCRIRCHYTAGDHPYMQCRQIVSKTLSCGHELRLECWKEPKRENCVTCHKSMEDFSRLFNISRNYPRDSSSLRRSSGGSPSFPKHSYSVVPLIQQKQRSFFSSCCLL